MPTEYTAAIEDGCTFREYVMGCARAFGACATLCDSPEVGIPEKFEPSVYRCEQVSKEKRKLARLYAMPLDVAIAEEESERLEEETRRADALAEATRIYNRYAEMRPRVAAWTPPTSEHVDLKQFMLQ